jgi:hypothetical protein
MCFKFVSSLIVVVPHLRFAHRVNSQHRLNFCSDTRKVHWNLFPFEPMGRQMGCYIPSCLELLSPWGDFEWLRAVSRGVPQLKAAARWKAVLRAVLTAVWTASPRAVVM